MTTTRPFTWSLSLAAFGLCVGPGSVATAEHGGAAGLAKLATQTAELLRGAAGERDPFAYTVTMANPQRHEFQVELRLDGLPGDSVQLELPKWNPGAYHLTNAHRNVRAVSATLVEGDQPGAALAVAKLDENTWEIAHGGAPVRVEYRVYCGHYSGIGGCYLDDAMGFINGAHVFMYAVGHKQRPIELRVDELPGGRRAEVVTGLPARGKGERKTFWANNFDALVDSPIHAGVVDTISYELGGRPIRATMSREGAWKADEVRDELRKITEAAAAVFGPLETALPFSDYTFIYHVLPDNSGGLEHLNSTVIGVDPWWFADERGKRRFWSVSAHEFFHLWNVKRIRPAVLGPFDYDREVHTTMLWFSEGFTSYYAALIVRRAGLTDEAQALEDLARRISAVETRPGRKLMSVEQSSWETWSKPDDRRKAYFSYYDKGAVIGMLLDLHLRASSQGLASTDTVFQELWKRWRATGLGLSPQDLEQVFVDQAGPGADEVRQMFADYVRGTVELDYDRYLAHAGYRLERTIKQRGPWIGAEVSGEDAGVAVRWVEHGGPADLGGLADGDVIQAIDGHPVDGKSWKKIVGALELGAAHRFTIERTGRVLELSIDPIEGGDERFEIVDLDDVTPQQTLLRRDWLGLEPS
ncbi:M61 glycyl aminopeptidase [Enhygromyxa salina]|uniref:M61 glycyl aminopeptidase n=1 Tax=Enhygromyxa salina TaxID=215803 RepID=A0A2S9YC20_9BACT|nr:PDZ domain-containing protein [Enhygromyxa salina]PRQ02551.1 M61 glycyl aminopeptidase [Enhygromyxa salina]